LKKKEKAEEHKKEENLEFPKMSSSENYLNFTVKDLYAAIFDEYKGEFKSKIKETILD